MVFVQGMTEFSYDTEVNENWDQVWVSVRRRTHLTVAVKACRDVKILFGTIMFDRAHLKNYLVTIDRNGNTSMIE